MNLSDHAFNFLDRLRIPVILVDRDYKIIDYNISAGIHLSLPPHKKNYTPQHCYTVTNRNNKPCWMDKNCKCPVREALRGGKRIKLFHPIKIDQKNSVELIVATPIKDEHARVVCVIEELLNITNLLEINEDTLPICSSCKRIHDKQGNLQEIENYLRDHFGIKVPISICKSCLKKHFPDLKLNNNKPARPHPEKNGKTKKKTPKKR